MLQVYELTAEPWQKEFLVRLLNSKGPFKI